MTDPRILVGVNTADDAAVFQIDSDRALVQTADFFTPIVDDPFRYGEIAAANALSDVYAMGGRPLTALNLIGMPTDLVPPPVIAAILRGGAAKAKEAGCAIVGGHTIRNPVPIYGMAVTGIVSPRRMMINAAARPGDWLVLTKPLGTGIITTGIKRKLTSRALAARAIATMGALNRAGADVAEAGLVRAATDVTGFGLLGHLGSMCRESGVGAEIFLDRLPVIARGIYELIEKECIPGGSRENLKAAHGFTDWEGVPFARQILLADAQTSGGLLLCAAPRRLDRVLRLLRRARTPCRVVIGRIIRSAKPRIRVRAHATT